MTNQPALTFARLLRQLRADVQLTQEELAEAAGLSPRSISDLERGLHRTTHKDTAMLLAAALSLAGPVAELFVAAARGKAPAAVVLAARSGAAPTSWGNLPAPVAGFIGRKTELAELERLAGRDRLVTIVGTGGAGKTRLAN